jgi:hypothetical protein
MLIVKQNQTEITKIPDVPKVEKADLCIIKPHVTHRVVFTSPDTSQMMLNSRDLKLIR